VTGLNIVRCRQINHFKRTFSGSVIAGWLRAILSDSPMPGISDDSIALFHGSTALSGLLAPDAFVFLGAGFFCDMNSPLARLRLVQRF
jgi:hypothetical protein